MITLLNGLNTFQKITQIITGCPPFMNRCLETSVVHDVLAGQRPPWPAKNMTDPLWALLQAKTKHQRCGVLAGTTVGDQESYLFFIPIIVPFYT
jgi:hypothetical protein